MFMILKIDVFFLQMICLIVVLYVNLANMSWAIVCLFIWSCSLVYSTKHPIIAFQYYLWLLSTHWNRTETNPSKSWVRYDFTILVIFVNFMNYITNMQEFGGQEIMDENFHSHYALVYSFFVFILQIWRIVFDYRILISEILP